MKQYVIDELRPGEYDKIKTYMDENFGAARMGEIYWIPLDKEILTDTQKQHTDCQPYYFAAALEAEKMAFELLVRSENKIRCNCICYATAAQREWLIEVADAIFERLEITT